MNIKAYRDALIGEGPLAEDWEYQPHTLVTELCDALEDARKTIWAVRSIGESHSPIVGYAVGEKADIEAFFADRKGYGLELERVAVQHIPAGFASKRESLLRQKEAHEKEVARINAQLKHIGG
jgi:hypothetical protein